MDDPWANAWEDPTKPASSTWASSRINDAQDSEADIGIPSWVAGADIQWAEPSDTQASLWNETLPSKEWNASPYHTISLKKSSVDDLSQNDRTSSPPSAENSSPSSPASPTPSFQTAGPSSSPPPADDAITRPSTPTTSSTSSPHSVPGSPDAFGTFEVGPDTSGAGVDPWSQSILAPAPAEPDTWGLEWEVSNSNSETEVRTGSQGVDEWEAAKQTKERQDRYVPPEVLASILNEFRELSHELWPKNLGSDQNSDNGKTFLQDRHSGMHGIEDLMTLVDRFIPQNLTLPPNAQFSKTLTSKHMEDALRITRHVAITRLSPMALYQASKGSVAWETSVKARPEVSRDDFLPPGWRLVEKEKEEVSSAIDGKKKVGGGLLSFFNRGSTTSPPVVSSSRSASPIQQTSAAPPGVGSARASMDSNISVPARVATPVMPHSPIKSSSTSSGLVESAPTPVPNSITPGKSGLTQSDVFETPQPASAVSRFFNRFSRSKVSGSGPRNSLALSTDDLEFLSDIVPSANDDGDEASQIKELTNMIKSSPLPTKLPPLLPPPPTKVLSDDAADSAPQQLSNDDDLFSLLAPTTSNGVKNSTPSAHLPIAFTAQSVHSPISPKTEIRPSQISKNAGQTPPSFNLPLIPGPPPRVHDPVPLKQTSTAITPRSSLPVSSPKSTFTFPPPPPAPQGQLPTLLSSNNAAMAAFIPQLPQSSQSIGIEPSVDAGFSDFHTSSMYPQAHFDTSNSSVFLDKSFISSSSASTSGTNDSFDDFDDFVSSPLRTPSPPRPPVKPMSLGHKPLRQEPNPPLPTTPPVKPQFPPRRVSRAADHQRTMSLLETAASRRGRWPAPPSPLPELLPPPPGNSTSLPVSGTTSDDAFIWDYQEKVGELVPSMSSPAVLPTTPQLSTFSLVPTFAKSSPHLRLDSPPITAKHNEATKPSTLSVLPTSPASITSKGLSAQDLSFFEGI